MQMSFSGWLLFLLVAWGWPGRVSAQAMSSELRPAPRALAERTVPAAELLVPMKKASADAPALARIPGGSFWMGNSFTNLYPAEGFPSELPPHEVPVSEFFIGRFEVANAEMAQALQWAFTNGLVEVGPTVVTNVSAGATNVVTNLYGTVRNAEGTKWELVDLDGASGQIVFTNGAFAVAAGKTNFPCIYASWYGALAFCNYLSDQAGLARAVDFGPTNWSVDVSAAGYRLPTEAEWEKACRGGNPGTHFPWPDDSAQGTNLYLYSIEPMKANYWDGRYAMSESQLTNHPMHPWFSEPVRNTPVGYYNGSQVVTNFSTNVVYRGADIGQTNDMANGYGLYDMAGNVYEWCADYLATNWYTNALASLPDPVGPPAGSSFYAQRVVRGGGWLVYSVLQPPDPSFQRCSFRASFPAAYAASFLGFRVARRPTAYETWAVGEGLDPLATNGVEDADFDRDGQSNGGEYAAGTQPTNPASFFKVSGVGPVAATVPLAYWGVSGRVYAVEVATNLMETNAWQFHAEVTNASTGESQIPVEAAAERRYLRIKARLEP